jgi:hypothetical protein
MLSCGGYSVTQTPVPFIPLYPICCFVHFTQSHQPQLLSVPSALFALLCSSLSHTNPISLSVRSALYAVLCSSLSHTNPKSFQFALPYILYCVVHSVTPTPLSFSQLCPICCIVQCTKSHQPYFLSVRSALYAVLCSSLSHTNPISLSVRSAQKLYCAVHSVTHVCCTKRCAVYRVPLYADHM